MVSGDCVNSYKKNKEALEILKFLIRHFKFLKYHNIILLENFTLLLSLRNDFDKRVEL
jgi:hypothetical protein